MNLEEDQSRWKVSLDESYEAQKRFPNKELWKLVKADKHQYYEIKGKYGVVYPYSESQLAVYFSSVRVAGRFSEVFDGRRISTRKGWTVIHDGEYEAVFWFPDEELEIAAEAIQAYRKRHISAEHLKRLVAGRQGPRNGSFSPSGSEFDGSQGAANVHISRFKSHHKMCFSKEKDEQNQFGSFGGKKMESPEQSLLTVAELSRWLSLEESTIRKKVCYGRIPHVKIGRSVRFRRSEIESWLDEQSTPSPRYNASRAVDLAEGD